MEVWEELGRAFTAEGDELLLRGRNGVFELRMNGQELMGSRAHGSEEALAGWVCGGLSGPASVLIGGLGFGYTLRAALNVLPGSARVVVAELLPEVVSWVRGPVSGLAGRVLEDPRVDVVVGDAGAVLAGRPGEFDAVILDVDNGPGAPVRSGNAWLFGAEGLRVVRQALRPGGLLGVWSADRDEGFEGRLTGAGFSMERRGWNVVEGGGRVEHVLYRAWGPS